VNREFLQHDYYTDIITFDYTTRSRVNGDIYISLDTVQSNAEQEGTTFVHELHRIIIHGLLHLTGQGDKTPETKVEMTAKEDSALKKIPHLLQE
jgi:rRNA maturation RNase YbeY